MKLTKQYVIIYKSGEIMQMNKESLAISLLDSGATDIVSAITKNGEQYREIFSSFGTD